MSVCRIIKSKKVCEEKGCKGCKGCKGDKGEKGISIKGDKGDKGDQGIAGATGPTGDAGTGVSNTVPTIFDDFIVGLPNPAPNDTTFNGWVITYGGLNSSVTINSSVEMDHPGVLDFAVDLTESLPSAGISMGSPLGTIVLNTETTFTYETLVYVSTYPFTTNIGGPKVAIGLHDSYGSSEPTTGIYFELSSITLNVSSPRWIPVVQSNGIVLTVNGPALELNTWTLLQCNITIQSNALFYFLFTITTSTGSVSFGPVSLNFPFSTSAISPNIRIYGPETTTSGTFDFLVDDWYHQYSCNPVRV